MSGDPYKAVRKSRRQMIWRLMLVGSLVVLGLKIPGVEAVSMFIGIALIQPASVSYTHLDVYKRQSLPIAPMKYVSVLSIRLVVVPLLLMVLVPIHGRLSKL